MREASLVVLEPWSNWAQHSSVILLKGLLHTTGQSSHRLSAVEARQNGDQVGVASCH